MPANTYRSMLWEKLECLKPRGSLTSDVEKGQYLEKVKLACSLMAFQREVHKKKREKIEQETVRQMAPWVASDSRLKV